LLSIIKIHLDSGT